MPFKKPSLKLSKPATLTADQISYLNLIKPWSKNHWICKFGTPSDHTTIKEIKDSLKYQLEIIQNYYCAFCGINLKKVREYHREHIAPQYKFPEYIFEPENIVLACVLCNDYKGTKITVKNNTGIYHTTIFNILHPLRDNFCEYLECDFHNKQLIFSIKSDLSKEDEQITDATIKCVGLNDPHLISQRGMIILYEATNPTPEIDDYVKSVIDFIPTRKAT